jgi:hypothetical protein
MPIKVRLQAHIIGIAALVLIGVTAISELS